MLWCAQAVFDHPSRNALRSGERGEGTKHATPLQTTSERGTLRFYVPRAGFAGAVGGETGTGTGTGTGGGGEKQASELGKLEIVQLQTSVESNVALAAASMRARGLPSRH